MIRESSRRDFATLVAGIASTGHFTQVGAWG
jgi:hypothetical protein